VKFAGQGIGENRRDFPACFGAPNRKVDGFIGNLTEQSKSADPAFGSAARGARAGVQQP
jgi:hypothetical protein